MSWFGRRKREEDGRFGYAVVGVGHISGFFMDALRDSPVCRVAAVVSGSGEKAARAAKQYAAPHALTYDGFDGLRDHAVVHAVYLALPVSMHLEYTRRAAAAGKHVLCEKPMAATAAEAREMIAACREAGVRLSLAYRCPHTAVHQRARELVRGGALGPRQSLRLDGRFGFHLKAGWRDDPVLAGGGSLFDVGIYPLNAARFLLGEDPVAHEAAAVIDERGLEREVRWTSAFPGGAELRGWSSYRRDIGESLRITGARGSLLLDPAFGHKKPLKLTGELDGQPVEFSPGGEPSHFRLEAEALARAVREGELLSTPGEDGLADMVAMEAIYRAAEAAPGLREG